MRWILIFLLLLFSVFIVFLIFNLNNPETLLSISINGKIIEHKKTKYFQSKSKGSLQICSPCNGRNKGAFSLSFYNDSIKLFIRSVPKRGLHKGDTITIFNTDVKEELNNNNLLSFFSITDDDYYYCKSSNPFYFFVDSVNCSYIKAHFFGEFSGPGKSKQNVLLIKGNLSSEINCDK